MGEGLVEGIGVRLPPEGGDCLCIITSTLERLLSPSSSGPLLSGLLSEFAREGGDWRLLDVDDDSELRFDGRGESACPLPDDDTVGDCICPLPEAGTSDAR